jgi:hypothetical protein
LMSDPCFEVREELRLNRFVLINYDFPDEGRVPAFDSTSAGQKRQSRTGSSRIAILYINVSQCD